MQEHRCAYFLRIKEFPAYTLALVNVMEIPMINEEIMLTGYDYKKPAITKPIQDANVYMRNQAR